MREENKRVTSKTTTYKSWAQMLGRCRNINNHNYSYYGGRGIIVCERWLSFDNFLTDMGERLKGTSIDRIDNNKGYFKANCRWTTHKEQCRNRTSNRVFTYQGQTKILIEWVEYYGKDYGLVTRRMRRGWTIGEALFHPKIKNGQTKSDINDKPIEFIEEIRGLK